MDLQQSRGLRLLRQDSVGLQSHSRLLDSFLLARGRRVELVRLRPAKKSGASRGLLPINNILSEDLASLFGAVVTGWIDVDVDAVLGDEVVLDELFHGALLIRSFQILSLADVELTRVSAAAASSAGGGRPPGLGTEPRG